MSKFTENKVQFGMKRNISILKLSLRDKKSDIEHKKSKFLADKVKFLR